jgi:pimeloyl-ACP methyl ester carboxylesterase
LASLVMFAALSSASAETRRDRALKAITNLVDHEKRLKRSGVLDRSGNSFFWRHHRKRARGVVMLVHGFPGKPDAGIHLARRLFREGYDVFGARQAGHGHAAPDGGREFATLPRSGSGRYERRMDRLLGLLSDYSKTSKVHLLGLSLGGTAVTWMAAQHPEKVGSLQLYAPFFKGHDRRGWRRLQRLDRRERRSRDFGETLSRVPFGAVEASAAQQPYVSMSNLLAAARWAKKTRVKALHSLAHRADRPRALVVNTAADMVCDNAASEQVGRQIGARILEVRHSRVIHPMWYLTGRLRHRNGPGATAVPKLLGDVAVGFLQGRGGLIDAHLGSGLLVEKRR